VSETKPTGNEPYFIIEELLEVYIKGLYAAFFGGCGVSFTRAEVVRTMLMDRMVDVMELYAKNAEYVPFKLSIQINWAGIDKFVRERGEGQGISLGQSELDDFENLHNEVRNFVGKFRGRIVGSKSLEVRERLIPRDESLVEEGEGHWRSVVGMPPSWKDWFYEKTNQYKSMDLFEPGENVEINQGLSLELEDIELVSVRLVENAANFVDS